MRTAGPVAVLITCLLAAAARGAVVEVPHVRVTYEGITEQQARAIAETLSAARKVYAEGFGFDMPARVHCAVECGPGKGSRLFTDGEDAVFLSLPSADKCAPRGRLPTGIRSTTVPATGSTTTTLPPVSSVT